MWRKFSWLFFVWLLLLGRPIGSFAQQDVNVGGFGPYFDIGRNLTWGASGIGGINNNFLVSPNDPAGSLCVFFKNNNPTSSHTFSIAVSQSGDPRQSQFTIAQNSWLPTTLVGTVSPLAASTAGAVYIRTYAAARLVISVSGATTQAGSPDTVDVFAVVTHANACGPVESGIPTASIIKNVQAGLVTIPGTAVTGTAVIASVNTSKAVILFSGIRNLALATYSTTVCNIGAFDARVELTNANTVTAIRGDTCATALEIGFTILEFL